ncbi:uncharacterized protein V1516DRAFT_648624 [Lipomyces oligophaga]|uniref:uncharacterized protein n=1 Tax=Lipomyces oligophaga TaxID=45792 RepID=UPI0034CE4410
MALSSEYQGAIALLDLDRAPQQQQPQQQDQQQNNPNQSNQSQQHQNQNQQNQQNNQSSENSQENQLQQLPRIVMPGDDRKMGLRGRNNRTSIADLLSDASSTDHQVEVAAAVAAAMQQQQQHIYSNPANPPIDTQLLSPMGQVSQSAQSANQFAYSQSPVSPGLAHSQMSLPSLPTVMAHEAYSRHNPPTDPALAGVGVIPANPVRSGANASANATLDFLHPGQQPQQPQQQQQHVQAVAVGNSQQQSGRSASQSSSASRPYRCPHPGCKWTFARHSDQRRHLRSHYSPNFHCPYWRTDPTCHRNGGAFNRLDVLKRHLRLVHFVQLKDSDAGWCRLCQKMFASPRVFVEHCEKCADSVQPTEWKKVEGEPMPQGR